jgi:hypothetical protein
MSNTGDAGMLNSLGEILGVVSFSVCALKVSVGMTAARKAKAVFMNVFVILS